MNNLLRDEISLAVQEIVPVLTFKLQNEIKGTTANELSNFHFGLGLWIRNNILTVDSDIYRLFAENGISHRDDMSAILIQELHRRLVDEITD